MLRGKKELDRKLESIANIVNRQGRRIMAKTVLDIRKAILDRTVRGIDANGKPFRGYSAKPGYFMSPYFKDRYRYMGKRGRPIKSIWAPGGYREYKAKTRRSAGGTVNLFYTGNMLGAMKPLMTKPQYGAVGYSGKPEEEKKARAHNSGAGNLPKREFVGLTDTESTKILEDYKRRYKQEVRNAISRAH